jgi:membrane protein
VLTTVEPHFTRVRKRLARVFLIVLLVRTIQEMGSDDATHMSAGVAYYTLFSLFPLLLGLVTLGGMLVGGETLLAGVNSFAELYLPASSGDVVVTRLNGVSGALGIVAILGMLWSGSAIFGAITRAVNRAWDVHRDRPFYIGKLRQLLMALGTGLLFFLSLGTASFVRISDRLQQYDIEWVQAASQFAGLAAIQATSFLLTLCIFLFIYKFLPNTKTYWKYIWPGALVGALLFETAKNLFIYYLDGFTNFSSVYGSLAPVIVLLLWSYISSMILIFGAELSSEYGRLKLGLERGTLIQPQRQRRRSFSPPVSEAESAGETQSDESQQRID